MNELKQLAERLEQEAKNQTDAGCKAGLMMAACMAYEAYSQSLIDKLCK